MSSFKIEVMVFQNPTDHEICLDALGLDPVAPKSTVEIPLHLAAPYRKDNGQRGKSPLEQVAPQLFPVDKADHEAWSKCPGNITPQSKIVTVAPRMAQESPGVKALRDAKEAAVEKARQKALASPQPNVKA